MNINILNKQTYLLGKMGYKINGEVIISNSKDIDNVGIATMDLVDAKVSSKAITEQTEGSVSDVTGADEVLIYDAEAGALLRVTVDEFISGSGIGTLVSDFDSLNVTGVATFANIAMASTESSITLPDSAEIVLGDSSDFSMYHDGDHTYLDEAGQGNLKIRTNNFRVTNVAETKPTIIAQVTQGVELYYDGNKKLETTDTGAVVSGMLTATRFQSGDIAARNIITLGITTIQDHLEVNDSTGSGTEYNLNVKTNGSSTFGVLGNGAILLGNNDAAPFMATNDHHATSKKYVDDAVGLSTVGLASVSYVDQQITGVSTVTSALVELTGVPVGSVGLGTFVNGIVTDDVGIKSALQDLETSLAKTSSAAKINNYQWSNNHDNTITETHITTDGSDWANATKIYVHRRAKNNVDMQNVFNNTLVRGAKIYIQKTNDATKSFVANIDSDSPTVTGTGTDQVFEYAVTNVTTIGTVFNENIEVNFGIFVDTNAYEVDIVVGLSTVGLASTEYVNQAVASRGFGTPITKSSDYTPDSDDEGSLIEFTSGNATVSYDGGFNVGSGFHIINNSASSMTIIQGAGNTMYFTEDGTTGNRTLGARGLARVFYMDSSWWIDGSGLS